MRPDYGMFTPFHTPETDAAGIPRLSRSDDRCLMNVSRVDQDAAIRYGHGERGTVTDIPTGTRWKVFGAPCGAACFCAARVERIT